MRYRDINMMLINFVFVILCLIVSSINVSTTQNSATVSFSTQYPSVLFSVSVANSGMGAVSNCQNVPAGNCLIQGLGAPGQYNVTVNSTSAGFGVPSYTASIMVTLYNALQNPIISSVSYTDRIVLNFYSGGSIALTRYTAERNGVAICQDIPDNTCENTGLSPGTPYHFQVQSRTIYPTGGGSVSAAIDYFVWTMPPAPSGTSINASRPQVNAITVNWAESTQGVPGANKYFIQLYNSLSPNSLYQPGECQNVTGTSCTINNLISGAVYNMTIITRNANYTQVKSIPYLVSTLPQPNFTCNNNCSSNGDCILGTCNCYPGWNGIECQTNMNISSQEQKNTTVNSTWIHIDSDSAAFRFDLGDLIERDIDGNAVKSISLASLNWTFSPVKKTNVTEPIHQTPFQMKQWSYEAPTVNNYFFGINITFTQIAYLNNSNQLSDTFPIPFINGTNISLKVGSVKYSISISQWLFENLINTLELSSQVKLSNLNSTTPLCISPIKNITSNSVGDIEAAVSIFDDGKVAYARMPNRAIIDKFPIVLRNTLIQNTISNGTIQIISSIPHFFSNALIDPDFSLLINGKDESSSQDDCNSQENGDDEKNENWKKITIGVVVGVVGAAAVAIVVAIIIKKNGHQFRLYTYKLKGHATT
ncbi:hypothetical protein DFA_06895 [Cavenderia fasciculata]|uniref:Fibronectin type-III domain-containing protein n=1 Tax=Cavenderia fasciculata TaxID=261658 RepID=F4PWZ0_CACFS|nr:uncharacterized protein DFA_06895 [Cavenderia fasciculata]EGG19793.1 hypothetical protein DFA_06895 [Cavenderia fasciculata]|eukprot:XP_004358139.1 hypothetical protein DFA_06895 [Cavenderia fasciculata]